MQTKTQFEATHAMIVQNQDEILIPLDCVQIPSAKQVWILLFCDLFLLFLFC